MECRGCGKEPHEGYCYPILDGTLALLLVVLAIFVWIVLMLFVVGFQR